MCRLSFVSKILVSLILLMSAALARSQQTETVDFSELYELVYQIQVISPKAGSKSSIGSGFQVTEDGLLVTNYHVVSAFVQNPGTHKIKYRSHNGELGELSLVNFDVVNDLAILRHANPAKRFLRFSKQALTKGETVYALGNPRDYGVSLVRGPNNGFVEHSYNSQILFSGSLNPGMSGGPALDQAGDVVGVNVATAGSQLSFLVPAESAIKLVNESKIVPESEYQEEIAAQIKVWQRARVQDLIDRDWAVESFAGESLFGEIRSDFQCWGSTNEEDKKRVSNRVSKSCNAGNSLYLDRGLSAGQIYFSFRKLSSIELSSTQFSQTLVPSMWSNNRSNFENSTNYQCHVDFLAGTREEKSYNRITTCVRAFKKLSGLYDSLLLVERNSQSESLSTHLSISAMEKDQIQALNRKFMEESL